MSEPIIASVRSAALLAAPVVVNRLAVLMIITVDFVMTGHLSAEESGHQLAFLGLAAAMQAMLLITGIGFLQGTLVLASQAHGAGEIRRCGAVWHQGLIHALALGALMFAVCQMGTPFFGLIGFDADLAEGGGTVMRAFAWGIPPFYLYVVSTYFLEALKRPLFGMCAMIGANVLNVGLNTVLIAEGNWLGVSGAEGAVLGTSLVRLALFATIAIYILAGPGARALGVRELRAPDWALGRKLRRLGLPICAAAFLENAATATLAVFAGYLGTVALGGYQVAMNVTMLGFMSAIALAAATAVQTGSAVGRRDQAGIARAGWTGAGLGAVVLGGFATAMLVAPHSLAGLYTEDEAVRSVTAVCLRVAAPALLALGLQAVLAGALRGIGDVWVPAYLNAATYWVIAIPVAAVLAFGVDIGPAGLAAGLVAGGVCGAGILAARFRVMSMRPAIRA